MVKQFKILNYPVKLIKVKNINDDVETNKLKIINIDLKFNNPFKVPINSSSMFIKIFDKAHKIVLSGKVVGIINCPLNKKLLKKNLGVTEYLALKCGIKDNLKLC